jgi:CRISPR system Cascade subunit CasE
MHLIQLPLDITKAVRHLAQFMGPRALDNDSLVIKTALTETLGGPVIRPWAIHARRGPVLTIVGYGEQSADEVNARRALALPSLQAAVGEALSVEMPPLEPGTSYRFSVRLVPTVRVTPSETRRHGERDAYLVAADGVGPNGGLTRDEVYRDYLARRLGGAIVEASHLDSFRLVRFMRPKSNGQGTKTMPEASLSGVLCVSDPQALSHCLRAGIGRQRAYGYGMVQLQPARLSD